MVGFVLKKIVSRLLFPVPVCLELLVAGVLVLLLSRRRRLGLGLVLGGTVLLLAIGYGFPAQAILRRIEWHYPPPAPAWTVAEMPGAGTGPVWVVVLGSGMNEDAALPANSRFDARFLARVVEGVRLLRGAPGARLILSLPGRLPAESKQAIAKELCEVMGVSPERLRLVTSALDTEDEARTVASLVGAEPVVLVTSASHMLRAMRLFEGAGMSPVSCPTDFLTPRPGTPRGIQPAAVFPCADNVYLSERAVYECLGLAWAMVRGQTTPPPARP